MKRSLESSEEVLRQNYGFADRTDMTFNNTSRSRCESQIPWPKFFLASVLHPEEPRVDALPEFEVDTLGQYTDDPFSLDPYADATDVGRHIDAWAARTLYSCDGLGNFQAPLQDYSPSQLVISSENGDVRCFGMIYASIARLIGNMQDLKLKLTELPPVQTTFCMNLDFTQHCAFLTLDGIQVAQMSDQMTKCLMQLLEIASVRFEVVANLHSTLQCIGKAKRIHEAQIEVDIVIYGDASTREQISRLLTARKVYLQHNIHSKDYAESDNPHMLVFDNVGLSNEVSVLPGEASKKIGATAVQERIKAICLGETRDREFEGIRNTELDVNLKTRLLKHQEQALEFMLQREVGPLPKSDQLWRRVDEDGRTMYRHSILNYENDVEPTHTFGGILADDMGMGKTLSILSLMISRSSSSLEWSQEAPETNVNQTCRFRSRATLVVVWSLLVMNGWLQDIQDHVKEPLKVIKYHGKHREKKHEQMKDCDIVLTTYHTLAAERKQKQSPLKSIEWFRIALDEAHTVRRRATTLFAAVSELETPHRWCLTGTPIQNSLTDLGSLLAFLRLYPLDRPLLFQKHIINPFSSNPEEATERLRLLLDAVCLRRRIERLHLPPMEGKTCFVDMTKEEKSHYKETLDSMVYATTYGSRERYADTPFGKFQIQLQLRILCNHGTFQKRVKWSENDAQTQREEAVCSIGTTGEISCSCCKQRIPILGNDWTASRQGHSSRQVICEECSIQLADERPGILSALNANLTMAQGDGKLSSLPSRPRLPPQSFEAKFNTAGHSSKISALVEDLVTDLQTTKSIIFSCWTESLNLIAWHLDQRGVDFVRIDGSVEVGHRQAILDNFARNDDIRVLLMTTGTGAYGLNLAVANRVFILEPQWNPSVESQAIARVQRFPQTRRVKVIRYVVRDTVEADICRQQVGKTLIAEKGFAQVEEG